MDYLDIDPAAQKELLSKLKTDCRLAWTRVAQRLGVNRSMVYFYANGSCKIPKRAYDVFCKLAGHKPQKFQLITISNKLKTVNLPEFGPDLAEFLGILAGDGHLNSKTFEVSVALDSKNDREYADFVKKLFERLFRINPRRIDDGHVVRIKTYSKEIVEWTSSRFGLPKDRKMGRLKIPAQVKSDRVNLIAFLRGVYDTDGCVHRHHKGAAVEFISRDAEFLTELDMALKEIGFSTCLSGKSVHIYAKAHVERFMLLVNPSNPKHHRRYKTFVESPANFK